MEHDPIDCIEVGRYPKFPACFSAGSGVARGRLYFQPEGTTSWYFVDMGEAPPCWAGVLPKPTSALLNHRVRYYIEVTTKDMASARTAEFSALVVKSTSQCQSMRIAAVSPTGPAAVWPGMPGGFGAAAGGISVPVAVAGAAAAVGGTVVAVKPGGPPAAQPSPPIAGPTPPPRPSPTPEPTPGPGPTPAPGATPGPTPTPTPGPTPFPTPDPGPTPTPSPGPTPTPTPSPSPGALTVACSVTPGSGVAPLSARFSANPEGGSGLYTYAWAFGDGGTASVSGPTHVYSTVANYTATLRVTSGGQTADCSAPVSVTSTPTTQFELKVSHQGGGAGTITSSPAGINCATSTCQANFAQGSVVTLSAQPAVGSVFSGWSTDCSGTGSCSVTMDTNRRVQARFDPGTVTLRLTKTPLGLILGSVTSAPGGINCGTGCATDSATFPAGTTVTLRASAIVTATFQGWGGACSGTGDCVVTLNTDTDVSANFNLIGFAPQGAAVDPGPTAASSGLSLRSLLTSPGARGDVTVEGRPVIVGTSGESSVVIDSVAGTLLVEGFVRQASSAGTWRFDLGAGQMAPGGIGVVSGDVVELTPDSITFRVKGRAGERVAFTVRKEPRASR